MQRQNLDRQWNFRLTHKKVDLWPDNGDNTVDLPHDYSIIQKMDPQTMSGPNTGYYPGGVGIYEKKLFVPEEWKGKKLILEFEGIYMNATVRVNHHIAAQHPYGYTSFHCDITPYLRYGMENFIQVTSNNNALPNSRWYSGSGIYRHVWLMLGDSLHIAPWGVFATTPVVSEAHSVVSVMTTIENNSDNSAAFSLRTTLFTEYGSEAASTETKLSADANSRLEATQSLDVSPANLWSVDNPYLYTLKSEIIRDGAVIDTCETKIGIRSIAFSSESGFLLNGKPMKLKGGCVHHDCGLLGAAAYDRAEERKVELLKASGFNAVRCAHNPPSPAFLDACDRFGMLVIDEAFDCWREEKTPNDYSNYFETWWQKDMASMILRDRNHPSIILWSTGNEIVERDGRSEGYKYARKLADFVRSLDSTRAVINALCGLWGEPVTLDLLDSKSLTEAAKDSWGELTRKFAEPLDVVGYNYLLDRYESDGVKFPGRIICGTETFPKQSFEYWEAVEKLSYVIGDFVWTSLDYLGEAGIGHVWHNGEKEWLGAYPWNQAYCGDIDICGFKRPQSYYRDCVWGISKAPYIAVQKPEYYGKAADLSAWAWPDVVSSWTWPGFEGKPVIVDIYSRDDEIELLLNGISQGRKPAGKSNRYTASFEITYQPGELIAIAYKNNVETARTKLVTAGKPAAIRLTPDRTELHAKFGDLSYITVEILDQKGNIVHNASTNIYFTASGVGTLLAVGNGNPKSEEMYIGNQRRVHEGRAMAVVRANGEPGKIELTASAEGIPAAFVTINVG